MAEINITSITISAKGKKDIVIEIDERNEFFHQLKIPSGYSLDELDKILSTIDEIVLDNIIRCSITRSKFYMDEMRKWVLENGKPYKMRYIDQLDNS